VHPWLQCPEIVQNVVVGNPLNDFMGRFGNVLLVLQVGDL